MPRIRANSPLVLPCEIQNATSVSRAVSSKVPRGKERRARVATRHAGNQPGVGVGTCEMRPQQVHDEPFSLGERPRLPEAAEADDLRRTECDRHDQLVAYLQVAVDLDQRVRPPRAGKISQRQVAPIGRAHPVARKRVRQDVLFEQRHDRRRRTALRFHQRVQDRRRPETEDGPGAEVRAEHRLHQPDAERSGTPADRGCVQIGKRLEDLGGVVREQARHERLRRFTYCPPADPGESFESQKRTEYPTSDNPAWVVASARSLEICSMTLRTMCRAIRCRTSIVAAGLATGAMLAGPALLATYAVAAAADGAGTIPGGEHAGQAFTVHLAGDTPAGDPERCPAVPAPASRSGASGSRPS